MDICLSNAMMSGVRQKFLIKANLINFILVTRTLGKIIYGHVNMARSLLELRTRHINLSHFIQTN